MYKCATSPKQYNWDARLSAVEPAGWIYCCVRCTVTAAPDLRFGSLANFPQFPAYAGAYCTQPQRDGQAELAWVAKLCTEAVIHPNAKHASLLIETSELPPYAKTPQYIRIVKCENEN